MTDIKEGALKRWRDKIHAALTKAANDAIDNSEEIKELERLMAQDAEEMRKKYPKRFKDADEELERKYK
jgi:hypothetical protein